MAGRQRTTFAKLQKERARQEKQAAKRARRQGLAPEPILEDAPPVDINDPSTWRYADEIEATKDAGPADEIEASTEAAPTSESASGT